MIKFRDFLSEAKDASDIIKAFRKKKIIVKMVDYDTLVGRMSAEEVDNIMDNFNYIYQIRQSSEDKGLVYIELNGQMDESKASDKKELKALNKMLEEPSFKDRPDMMNILKRVAELQEILNESIDKKLLKKVEDFAFDAEDGGFELFDKWAKKNLSKEVYSLDTPEQPENMTDTELKKCIKDLKIK